MQSAKCVARFSDASQSGDTGGTRQTESGRARELSASHVIYEITHLARHRVPPGRTLSYRQPVTQLFANVFHLGNSFPEFGTKVTRRPTALHALAIDFTDIFSSSPIYVG